MDIFVKRPLIREDLNAIQYQSQEANTHLLHQMVHHGTILRGGGHSRQTITRSKNATVIYQSTTHMGSSSGSEYRASGSILNRANTTGRVGCGRNLYSTSSTTKSGSSSEATTYIGVSTNVLIKSNRTHGGGINRIHA